MNGWLRSVIAVGGGVATAAALFTATLVSLGVLERMPAGYWPLPLVMFLAALLQTGIAAGYVAGLIADRGEDQHALAVALPLAAVCMCQLLVFEPVDIMNRSMDFEPGNLTSSIWILSAVLIGAPFGGKIAVWQKKRRRVGRLVRRP